MSSKEEAMADSKKTGHGAVAGRGILRQLRDEHAQLSAMLRRVADSKDPDDRRVRFEELRRELIAHGQSEELEVYPVFEQFEDTCDLVEELAEDHTAMDKTMERLRTMDLSSEAWFEMFEDLMHDVLDHVEVEEAELFAAAEEHIDAMRAEELEQLYLDHKARLLRQVA
jgi:hemerythrin superfamily protein